MPTESCRLCSSRDLDLILDLGHHPLADTFLKKGQLLQPETTYPLQVLLCRACGHATSAFEVSEAKRYQENEYSYDSSNSKVSVQHFNDFAENVIFREGVGKEDLVVDIGSNVGTLLEAFRFQSGAKIMGVEPSANIASLAEKNNIPTIQDFFGDSAVQRILKVGKAKVITTTNVFNHIGNLDSLMRNILKILSTDGVFVIEVPYLLHLVQKRAFDTIYLEHVSYFAVKPLAKYFEKFGLIITDIIENDYMGGSIRLYVHFGSKHAPVVEKSTAKEEKAKLYSLDTYKKFSAEMLEFKMSLLEQIIKARTLGGKIIGIGAATKGNTLLNYCKIDGTLLDFITDASPLKVGKYTPGSHIPILSDEVINKDVTHAIILPWNIADFLKNKLAARYPKLAFIVPHMGQ